MIQKFRFKNFKSWEDTSNLRFSKLTGFFGTNSSGKTSILQFLLLLKQTIESSDRTQSLDFDRNYINLGSFKDIVFNHNTANNISFLIEFKNQDVIAIPDPEKRGRNLFEADTFVFEATLGLSKQSGVQINKFSYLFDGFEFEFKLVPDKNKYILSSKKISTSSGKDFSLKRTQGRVWDLPQPYRFYGFPEEVKSRYQNAGFLSDLEFGLELQFKNIFYLGPLRDYPQREYTWGGSQPSDMGQRGEKSVDAILSSNERNVKISRGKGKPKLTLEEYVAYWLKELELIYEFKLRQIAVDSNLYRVYVKKNKNSPEVLITDVGFGVSQILPVITLCFYAPENSILIIEQPEIHLHPKVQAGLADVFIDAIKNRNIQIILESHSEHLLKRIQRRIAEGSFDKNDSSLYFCSNDKERSKAELLDIDLFGIINNWPKNFFGDNMGEIIAVNKAISERKKHEN